MYNFKNKIVDITSTHKLPVLFYVHGGGYIWGDVSWAGPGLLLEEDILLVSIQYRLGPFGFLSLGTSEYSGNMGLKDQLLALEWVNENIHNFGGDNKNITIYGHSAGGSSVSLHMLSPSSRGQFQKSIVASGAAYSSFAYLPDCDNHTDLLRQYLASTLNKSETAIDDELIKDWVLGSDSNSLIGGSFVEFLTPIIRSRPRDQVWAPIVESNLNLQ